MPIPETAVAVMLDTHAIVWWQAGGTRLSRRARELLEAASTILVSPISFWELSMLVGRGRVALDRSTGEWARDFVATDRVEVADLSPAVAVAAGELREFHGDPADRLIVATAVARNVRLVTKDDRITSFARESKLVRTVW
jgi:PIN domain nuclease of toxin-antitoxin system